MAKTFLYHPVEGSRTFDSEKVEEIKAKDSRWRDTPYDLPKPVEKPARPNLTSDHLNDMKVQIDKQADLLKQFKAKLDEQKLMIQGLVKELKVLRDDVDIITSVQSTPESTDKPADPRPAVRHGKK